MSAHMAAANAADAGTQASPAVLVGTSPASAGSIADAAAVLVAADVLLSVLRPADVVLVLVMLLTLLAVVLVALVGVYVALPV